MDPGVARGPGTAAGIVDVKTRRVSGDGDGGRRWRARTASEPRARSTVGGTSLRDLPARRGRRAPDAAARISLKVLLENLLRTEDGANITADDIRALAGWDADAEPDTEIQFTPARVIMQDFTGVPCVVDLATMREAMADLGGDPAKINPLAPGRAGHRPLRHRRRLRHAGRVRAQRRARVRAQPRALPVPALGPDARSTTSRSCRRAPASCTRSTSSTSPASCSRDATAARPTPTRCVGTDSHTTMVNGLGVLGWGVGGIEAEAAMLGQPVSHADPARRRLQARPASCPRARPPPTSCSPSPRCCASTAWSASSSSSTAPASRAVPLANRATIGNMSPEYGSTVRDLPDRRRDAALPAAHRPHRRAGRARRGLRQGAGPLARPGRRAASTPSTLELDLVDRRAVARRPEAPAGPRRRSRTRRPRFRGALRDYVAATTPSRLGRRGGRRVVPGLATRRGRRRQRRRAPARPRRPAPRREPSRPRR